MSVDLRSISMFGRSSVLLMDDSVVKLEHTYTDDRLRRFMFDRIETVLIWRRTPWGRLILVGLILGGPGIGLQFAGDPIARWIGISLIFIAVVLCGWFLYCGATTIRIVASGRQHQFKGLFRPGKLRRFREKLLAGIELRQGAAKFQAAPTSAAPTSVPPGS